MTTHLPAELIDQIVEHLYDGMFGNESFNTFVKICLISQRYKFIMYQRRKPLMQTAAMFTHRSWTGFYADPFKNPYTVREVALLTILRHLFTRHLFTNEYKKEEARDFPSFIWKHQAWLDQQLVANASEFSDGYEYTLYSSKTGPYWPGCCVLGDIQEKHYPKIYKYGFVLYGHGIFLLGKRDERFDYGFRMISDIHRRLRPRVPGNLDIYDDFCAVLLRS